MNVVKSVLHNIGVLLIGFIFAFLSTRLDLLLGIPLYHFLFLSILGYVSLAAGFLLRTWATYYFYEERMKVIVLTPQRALITSGPYRFSRNPLYLGGNIFIFFGAMFVLGSTSGIFLTIIGIFATDIMIRREERQLEQAFGKDWVEYKKRVRRWI